MKINKSNKRNSFLIPKNFKDILNTSNKNYNDTYDLIKVDFKAKIENNFRNNIRFYDIPSSERSPKLNLSNTNFKSIHRFKEISDKMENHFKISLSSQKKRSFENSLRSQIKKEEKNLLFLSEM